MELLEAKVGSGSFLESLTEVNMEISRKRVERKKQRAIEKATDPVAAAERRRERTEAGKVSTAAVRLYCVPVALFALPALTQSWGPYSSKWDQILLGKIGKRVGFCVYRRFYLVFTMVPRSSSFVCLFSPSPSRGARGLQFFYHKKGSAISRLLFSSTRV